MVESATVRGFCIVKEDTLPVLRAVGPTYGFHFRVVRQAGEVSMSWARVGAVPKEEFRQNRVPEGCVGILTEYDKPWSWVEENTFWSRVCARKERILGKLKVG